MIPLTRRAVPVLGFVAPSRLVTASLSLRTRLLSTLAVLEQRDGELSLASLNTFTAAKKLGGDVHGFIAGKDVSKAAELAAKVEGVHQIVKVENESYEKVSASRVEV